MKKAFFLVFLTLCVSFIGASAMIGEFTDDFSEGSYSDNGWSQDVLLGNPSTNYITQSGRLAFHFPVQDTWIYMVNERTLPDGLTEALFENIFSDSASYGLICRYNPSGWYEFRVNVSGEFAGSYSVYKYDRYLKEQGKNPFVVLHPGMERFFSYDIKTGMNQKNRLGLSCDGETIRVFINGVEQHPLTVGDLTDYDFSSGDSGFTVQNSSRQNAQLDVVNFSYSPETK